MADNIPSLDDLLKDIREEGEPQSSSALAVVPKKPEDLVEEDIDSQILSILGLEEVFDLTYEEYASLLKEAAVKGRMPDSQMTTESIELVTNELKRVRNKTGRFKVKPKKVDINKVLDRKQPTPPGAIVKAQKLIPQAAEVAPEQEKKPVVDTENLQEDLLNGIGNILESLITIRTLLSSQSKTEQKAAQEDRKETEKKKKKERESTLEKKKPKSPILKGLTKPVDDFFGAIKRFFTNVLLGSVVLGLFRWLKDPKNQKAVDGFANFLQNNAGLILGGLLAISVLPLAPTLLALTSAISTIAIPALTAAFGFLASPAGLLALATIATKARESREIDRLAEEEAKRREISKDQVLRERQSARNNPLNILGEALSSGGLDISGGGGISLSQSMNVDPKAKRAPTPKMSAEDIKKYNNQIANLKPGSGEKVSIPGIGSVVAGRNLVGMSETKYFDPSGNSLSKFQWAQRMADAGNAAGAKAAVGRDVKPTPQPKSSVQPQTPAVPKASQSKKGLPPLPKTGTGSSSLAAAQQYGAPRENGRRHAGVDFDAGDNDTFYSRIGGEVIYSANAGGGYGNVVDVYNKELGVTERIAEGSKNLVRVGQRISPGTPVQQGTHQTGVFHYEIRKGKATGSGSFEGTLDPLAFLKNPKTQTQVAQSPTAPSAQVAQTPVDTPSIPSPTGRGNIVPLPIPTGGGAQQASSGTAPNQAPVPRFSSEDPNNTTTMVVRAIYNIVG